MTVTNTKEMAKFAKMQPVGKKVSIKITGKGSLVARRASDCTRYYYEYRHDGSLHRHPFGIYDAREGDPKGSNLATRYTLGGAKFRAEALSRLQEEVGDLIGYFAEQRQVNADSIQANLEKREEQKRDASRYSLAKLCEAYGDHLSNQGKASASTVRNALKLWVLERQPELAAKKASEITSDDVMVILSAVIDAGHRTMTNRLRSYLSASFAFGIGSASDPLINSQVRGFKLLSNPVAIVKPVQSFEVEGERALSFPELSVFLERLYAENSAAAAAVLLAIRLGGQRMTQLLAVTPERFDREENTVTIVDSKGRRRKPRLHTLPVIEAALPLLLDGLSKQHIKRNGLWAGLTVDTVSKLVGSISNDLEAESIEPFTLRDLRRTCETRMAAMGINKDLRAQIQSHGLSGVQAKHYDKHDYMEEKREALKVWNQRLDELLAGSAVESHNVPRADHG